jgi:hypothetical protein
MAVGGMVGGGISSTLGVVVGIAGEWAWFSFAAAGLIALTAGYSYVKLSAYYGEGGGGTRRQSPSYFTRTTGFQAGLLVDLQLDQMIRRGCDGTVPVRFAPDLVGRPRPPGGPR